MIDKKIGIPAVVLAGCAAMAWVDAVLAPGYAIKSCMKIFFFLVLPVGYALLGRISFRGLFSPGKKRFLLSVLLGLGVYALILGAFLMLRDLFDFSAVTGALQTNAGVDRDNFLFVALYISLINSFLEEFFFRGFAFLMLKQVLDGRLCHLFSAGAFALYHIAIMTGWFSPALTVLLIVSLFGAGLVLNRLSEKSGTFYASWMVHMFANFSINTVGFILFDIL